MSNNRGQNSAASAQGQVNALMAGIANVQAQSGASRHPQPAHHKTIAEQQAFLRTVRNSTQTLPPAYDLHDRSGRHFQVTPTEHATDYHEAMRAATTLAQQQRVQAQYKAQHDTYLQTKYARAYTQQQQHIAHVRQQQMQQQQQQQVQQQPQGYYQQAPPNTYTPGPTALISLNAPPHPSLHANALYLPTLPAAMVDTAAQAATSAVNFLLDPGVDATNPFGPSSGNDFDYGGYQDPHWGGVYVDPLGGPYVGPPVQQQPDVFAPGSGGLNAWDGAFTPLKQPPTPPSLVGELRTSSTGLGEANKTILESTTRVSNMLSAIRERPELKKRLEEEKSTIRIGAAGPETVRNLVSKSEFSRGGRPAPSYTAPNPDPVHVPLSFLSDGVGVDRVTVIPADMTLAQLDAHDRKAPIELPEGDLNDFI